MTDRERILARLMDNNGRQCETTQLCDVSAEVTGVDGVTLILVGSDTDLVSLSSTDPMSTRIGELQLMLNQGPGIDAHVHGRPVLEPDLQEELDIRWPEFRRPAIEAGARAVYSFPLRVGGVRLGAINFHSAQPGPLKDEQHRDALIVADLVARAIVLLDADAQPEQLESELRSETDSLAVVNQAAGMASVQLKVSVGQALVRLRVFSFGKNQPIVDVAGDVVARRLRFDSSGMAHRVGVQLSIAQ